MRALKWSIRMIGAALTMLGIGALVVAVPIADVWGGIVGTWITGLSVAAFIMSFVEEG